MPKNFLGNPIRWIWTMKKLNTPLSVSSYSIGTKMGQEVFDYPQCLSATWYDYGNLYFDEEEILAIEKFLFSHIDKDKNYPDKIAKSIYKVSKEIKKQIINKEKILNLSLPELIELFKKKNKLFLKMIGYMSYRGSVEMGDIFRKKLSSILYVKLSNQNKLSEIQNYLDSLSVPLHPSVIMEEKQFALELSNGFGNLTKTKQDERIKLYKDEYDWLSYHWFVGKSPTDKQIFERLQALSNNSQQELKKIKKERLEIEFEIKQIEKKLKFTKQESHLLKQYREWIFLRTFVKDNINLAAYKLLPILYEIVKRKDIEPQFIQFIPYLTLEEIYNIKHIPKEKIKEKINSRKNGFSAGIINGNFTFEDFEKPKMTKTSNSANRIIGQIAYKGKVRGIARILQSPKEQNKLKKGEILVTPMTTPDFLPAMERAAAFVTDEGGITCHAAIVAREMKKPCIIGTKNATKILRDGDKIEVNAIKGMVEKI